MRSGDTVVRTSQYRIFNELEDKKLFSVIMPAYNAAPYIVNSLNSVIEQEGIRFEEEVEIIIIDDGSTDHTVDSINPLLKKYPNNIYLFKSENIGVARARNLAIQKVSGSSMITTFLDSDDIIEPQTFSSVKKMFNNHPHLNIATVPISYFGRKTGEHGLNYRFYAKERVSNILETYKDIHFNMGGFFIKTLLLKQRNYVFEEHMDFWEDALFINEIFLDEQRYGLVRDGRYLYRKREEMNSLVDASWFDRRRYDDLFDQGYDRIMQFSIQKYGKIIPYVQFLIIYHLKLFFYQDKTNGLIQSVLTDEEIDEFKRKVNLTLNLFDTKHILEQPYRLDIDTYFVHLQNKQLSMDEARKRKNDKLLAIDRISFNTFTFRYKGVIPLPKRRMRSLTFENSLFSIGLDRFRVKERLFWKEEFEELIEIEADVPLWLLLVSGRVKAVWEEPAESRRETVVATKESVFRTIQKVLRKGAKNEPSEKK